MRKRLIPVLSLDRRRRLVKTVGFGERTYVGDPFNVVRLFNEKEVDEICLLDIDATVDGREPDFGFLRELAAECFMPLAYGGGIASPAHGERLVRDGIEKLVLGHRAYDNSLVTQLASAFGSQAIVSCVDVRGAGTQARCYSKSGTVAHDVAPLEACMRVRDAGAGEVILQSIDRDGSRNGFDLELIEAVAPKLSIPLIALGGARDVADLTRALASGGSAAASGSAFVFIGRLRAMLVSYPDARQMDTTTAVRP